ncbi:molybdenum cofactor guanylyltransferase [Sphingomonas sp. XXL09]|uniref:molybdenum cofactor guanylyltransferase n=1 Tax=Sphingomonas sp. XXL09 TaxID=3457787 RepID=UPI00406BB286
MQRADSRRAPRPSEPRAGGQVGAGASGAQRLILGAILAGGQSRRFGSDKAVALLDGARLIDLVRAQLAPHVDTVVVVGRDGGIADLPAPGLGPLGGIAAALDHAAAHGFGCVLTVPCDTPRLPEPMLEALTRRAPAYCSDAPVIGFWPAVLRTNLLNRLGRAGADRSVASWARSVGALPIASPTPLANVNRPEDLMAL